MDETGQVTGGQGHSFRWLNTTQFLGALNDNIFQFLMILFLIGLEGDEAAGGVTAMAGMIFVIPFLLFTPFAGKLADRISKRDIVVVTKAVEVIVMVLGVLAFISGSAWAVYIVLFMMCTQSAFFGPSKYGIVPELVPKEQLSRANSYIESLTFLAIVVGTALAPWLSRITGRNYALAAIACVLIALSGFIASVRIRRTIAIGNKSEASVFFVKDVYRTLMSVRGDKDMMMTIFASAYFMLIGAFMKLNLIPYGIDVVGLTREGAADLFVIAAVGIGIGSFVAGRVSGRNVEFGIVPLGALGFALGSMGLALIPAGHIVPVYFAVFLSGASAGLFIVPIHAFIQLRSPNETRGQVVAASGFLGWIGVLVASLMLSLFTKLDMSPAHGFLVLGALTLVLAVTTLIKLPDFFVRFILIMVTRICYRIKVVDSDNVPSEGGVLLVSNHVSWVDAVLLNVTQQRRIRFVMDRDIYEGFKLKWILKLMRVILISQKDPPKKLIASLREARQAIDDGWMVCIFAEGAVTRTGGLRSFKAGFERILKGRDTSIVPVYIGGAWGSIFSWYGGKLMATLPRKFPYPITILFGRSMPSTSTAFEVRRRVSELSSDCYQQLKTKRRPLGEMLIRSARKNWSRQCINDTTGKRLNYGTTLTGAVAIAARIKPLCADDKMVGIMLPPSVAGAMVNMAVTLLGKTSVNLSYIVSEQSRASAIEQCGLRCVISSKKFLEKAGISGDLPGLVLMEDLAETIDNSAKRNAWLKARFMPTRMLSNYRNFSADDVATIIFSSGSTGKPKGVMLTHHNILSDIESALTVLHVGPDDKVCGILPFFHSFGFTVSIWLPLMVGASTSYMPNALDSKAVVQGIAENGCTVLVATPTFLLGYIRRASRQDFATIRMVLTGAEKLKKRVADKFAEQFGVRPFQGYGATELSPIATLNVPDVELGGVFQRGTKEGTVGPAIPGVAAKVVDLDTREALAPDQPGLLLIKGPNVMLGYLNNPEKTADVLRDGWYDTGDIASIDDDGFVTISDRLARFSKIAGEMVPHIAVEDICFSVIDASERAVAVTSVPNAKKGEELVVLYVAEYADADVMYEAVSQSDLPNICKPKRDNYLPIEKLPLLGSGKLDIMKLKAMAVAAKGLDPTS